MRLWIFLLLLPFWVHGIEHPKPRRIALCQNFITNPKDPAFLDSVFLSDVRKALALQQVSLELSDLTEDLSAKDLAYVVLWNKPRWVKEKILKRLPKQKAILFMWEPPTVLNTMYSEKVLKYFKRIYTWDDDLVDNKRFFKFHYPALTPMEKGIPSFEEKKLLTFISANKSSKHPKQLYTERLAAIEFFDRQAPDDFEFYGQGWEKNKYQTYRGAPEDKMAVLKKYRFSIAYENMHDVKGYVSEKIFNCFAAGVIPIYWGASNITSYVPKECFIDRRDFSDNASLYAFIRNMDKATYEAYLKNAQAFLKTDKAKLFSMEMFHVTLLEAVRFP